MQVLNALITIAMRDVIKLLHDRTRIIASLIFPLIFIAALGGSLDANLSGAVGYNFIAFVFTGVIAQTLFQSTASGIISLVEDRQNDFAQAMFVTPVSRYVIIAGKIVGESIVALTQLISILILGVILGVPLGPQQLLGLAPAAVIACLFGGAFGTIIMANLSEQRKANQIFPFLIFPQFFLAGVFAPIKNLPPVLYVLSRISPMTYAVDFVRGLYYWGSPEYDKIVLQHPLVNLGIIAIVGSVFLIIGTLLFVRNERNR